MSVLIIGGDSLIGSALCQQLGMDGFDVVSTTRRKKTKSEKTIYVDLGDTSTFANIDGKQYNSVVFCSAITNVKYCQDYPEETRRINVDGTNALASKISQEASQLIFISSNMVFDGKKPFKKSTDKTNPITEYGKQKALVEEYICKNLKNATVIRFGKIISPEFALFVDWKRKLLNGKKIYPFADKQFAPVSLSLAIKVLKWLIVEKKIGLFQFTAKYDMTYEDAALRLADLTGTKSLLIESVRASGESLSQQQENTYETCSTLEITSDLAAAIRAPLPYEVLNQFIAS